MSYYIFIKIPTNYNQSWKTNLRLGNLIYFLCFIDIFTKKMKNELDLVKVIIDILILEGGESNIPNTLI